MTIYSSFAVCVSQVVLYHILSVDLPLLIPLNIYYNKLYKERL